MCEDGGFRRDLLYRLNAMTLEIPPLRQRPEDIEPLALRFVAEANAVNGRNVRSIEPRALAILRAHHWPGNVRELRNTIERAVVIAPEASITVDDLPLSMRDAEGMVPAVAELPHAPESSGGFQEVNLRAELDRVEADHIRRALHHTGWDRNEAAKLLGLPLRTLARKIQAHGLKKV
jgi:DNA-binding NtrC family response regulator